MQHSQSAVIRILKSNKKAIWKISKKYNLGTKTGWYRLYTTEELSIIKDLFHREQLLNESLVIECIQNNQPVHINYVCFKLDQQNELHPTKIRRIITDLSFTDPKLWEDDHDFLHYDFEK